MAPPEDHGLEGGRQESLNSMRGRAPAMLKIAGAIETRETILLHVWTTARERDLKGAKSRVLQARKTSGSFAEGSSVSLVASKRCDWLVVVIVRALRYGESLQFLILGACT